MPSAIVRISVSQKSNKPSIKVDGKTQDFYDVEQFRRGLDVELEHGKISKKTNITNDNPLMTGKIALAHLNEFFDYYTRLDRLEKQADKFWKKKKKR